MQLNLLPKLIDPRLLTSMYGWKNKLNGLEAFTFLFIYSSAKVITQSYGLNQPS